MQCPIPSCKKWKHPGPAHRNLKCKSARWRPAAKEEAPFRFRTWAHTKTDANHTPHPVQEQASAAQSTKFILSLSATHQPCNHQSGLSYYPLISCLDRCSRLLTGPISCLDGCSRLLAGLLASIPAHSFPSNYTVFST